MKKPRERHPVTFTVFAAALLAYSVLSAAELVRRAVADPLTSADVGFHAWEIAQGPGGGRPFRWTRGRSAYLLRPPRGSVLGVSLFSARPESLGAVVPVELYAEGQLVDALFVARGEWRTAYYYLPPIVGPGAWSRLEGRAKRPVVSVLGREVGRVRDSWHRIESAVDRLGTALIQRPDILKIFDGWDADAGPRSLWVHVQAGDSFVPSDLGVSADHRDLGIGVGELTWMDLPESGVGLYRWEADQAGVRFRWTTSRASLPLTVDANPRDPGPPVASFRMRAGHPDVSRRPVEVGVFWNASLLTTVRLVDALWTIVEVAPAAAAGESGVLSLRPSRTWNPDRSGLVPGDRRDLGVGLTGIRWRRAGVRQ